MSKYEEYWNEILIASANYTNFVLFIPILFLILNRKYLNKSLTVFAAYCVLTIILNYIESSFLWFTDNYEDYILPILEKWDITNTFFLSIFYYLKNILLIGLFYNLIYPKKNLIHFISGCLALLLLVNYFFYEGYKEMGLINPILDSSFLIFLPLFFLWKTQINSLRVSLIKNPYFWISIGLILPNLLSLFIYVVGDFVYENDFILYIKFYVVRNIFEIIAQILFSIGFAHSYYARFIQTL